MIWLDEFTQYVGGAARLHLGANQAIARMTDFQVMRQLTSEAAARAIAAAKINRRASDEDEHLTSLALFFTSPGEITLDTYACAVGRDLALAFEGARATEDVGRRAMAFAKQKFITYVDVADRAFRIGHEHHLRALVLVRIPAAERARYGGESSVWGPDEDDGLRIFATWGRIGELADHQMDWIVGSGFMNCERSRTALGHIKLADNLQNVIDEFESFLQLIMAFAAVADKNEKEFIPAAPQQARERVDRATRRRWRKFSLFSVHRLRAPADNFGRQRNAGGERQLLSRRVPVVGHFKLQPHGPGGRERKLIFVNGYQRGPVDGIPIRPIVRLVGGYDGRPEMAE